VVVSALWVGLVAPAVFPDPGLLAADASVVALRTESTGRDIYASFSLQGAFTDEIREEISAGLPVTFTYYLEVARRRPFWFDKTLVSKTVSTTVTYDTLTHQYSLSKKVNDEVTDTSVAVSDSEMQRWMTSIERVRLADPTDLGDVEKDPIYVRVKSRLQKRFVLFFIPWGVGTRWEKTSVSLPVEGTGLAR